MAELANTLAFSAYDQAAQPTNFTSGLVSGPVQQGLEKHEQSGRDRDSGVFLSDDESLPPTSRPSSFSLKHTPSTKSTLTAQHADSTGRRLRRPADLNLGTNTTPDPAKPKSELELRYDLIRKSQTQSKAALKSPTQLLKDRLGLSPKKKEHDEKVRTFTPPKPMLNGCILPGPAAQMEAFTGSSVRARTEKGGRPAWWCKFDKLVVFDGIEEQENGELKIKTRTSKGLSIARRRGDTETVIIPLDCLHCQEMLNRQNWKYDIQVCKRSVCWDCKERCKWEREEEKRAQIQEESTEDLKTETNRDRADSVLQDERVNEEDLMAKVGIEQGPRSPIDAISGIEERLENGETRS